MRLAVATLAITLLTPSVAGAVDISYAIHAEGSAARMVGDRKVDQFGWGGGGLVSPEMTIGSFVGVELPLGGIVLSPGTVDEPGFVPDGVGYSLFALPGVRLRPFGRHYGDSAFSPGGLWIAGGGGLALTGNLTRPAVDARLGFDFFASGLLRGGPSVGYLQIIETESISRPEDARMVLFGLHGAIEPPPNVGPKKDGDRDGDGYRDGIDKCPDDAEDFDEFEDGDGCPDKDNDKDGINDTDDDCPMVAEDKDGFEDDDGCPDKDNDEDGLLDEDDNCPDEPEDKDGFQDDDGCPETDNDGDGMPDSEDKCPDEMETVNNYADDDGCPDDVMVRVVGDEIVLDDRIYFRVNHAEVQFRSRSLIMQLAKLLNDNPAYALVKIQGHADDTGEAEYNKRLSLRRSKAVRQMLVLYGVDPKRLVVEAYGEEKPAISKGTVHARTKNRRVEFLILRRRPMHEVMAEREANKRAGQDPDPKPAPDDEAPNTDDADTDPSDDNQPEPDEEAAEPEEEHAADDDDDDDDAESEGDVYEDAP